MSKNRRAAKAAEPVIEETSGTMVIQAVVLSRTVKIAGEFHRSGSYHTDLSHDLAEEIVNGGSGSYVDVEVEEIVDEDGVTVIIDGETSGEETQETA